MNRDALRNYSDRLYAEQVKARESGAEPSAYELTLNGVQKLVAGAQGFLPLDLETYLRNGFVLNALYR